MNLDKKLIEILDKAMSGIDKGTNFVTTELPDVINQLLLWYGVYYGLLTLLGLCMIGASIYAATLPKKGKRISDIPDKDGDYDSKVTWSHDRWGKPAEGAFSIWIPSGFIALMGVLTINLTWLQIWIAPKIWLIEYTANLVK